MKRQRVRKDTAEHAQQRRIAARRRMIVDFAMDRFRNFGTRRVTMDELARELRLSKKTLYQYFPSKEALVWVCIEGVIDGVSEAVRHAVQADGSVAQRMVAAMRAVARVPQQLSPELIGDVKLEFPHLWERIDERRRAALGTFETMIREGVAAGEIWPTVDPKVLVRVQLAILERVMVPEVLAAGEFTPMAAVSTILTLLCKGLFTEAPELAGIWDGESAAR